MKKIVIKSITLRNWRGEKERTTHFNANTPTSICGGNGLGKSRHFDAFCWLLFGKDSQDRKDFNLRTYDANHNELHHCECSVEAVLNIDGTDLTIKREFKEQWVKPRGQVEEVFKGNITECTWNGVPVKVGEFQQRVSGDIIDETVFKMITNPRYFTEKMKWQLQREQLLQMAGTKSDEEIAAGNADFRALLDTLNGKSLSDYRKEVAAEKKRLKTDLAEIQPRIDQTQKMMPEAEDWDDLERQHAKAKEEIAGITKQIQNAEARNDAAFEHDKAISKEIHDLIMECQQLEQDAIDNLRREAEKKNAARTDVESRLKTANSELSNVNIDLKHAKDRREYLDKQIASLDEQLEVLRNEWREINSSAYNGSDICPHCGQRLPENKITEARRIFEDAKTQKITINNEKGKSLSKQKSDYVEELKQKLSEVKSLESRVQLKQDEINHLYKELEATPKIEAPRELPVPTTAMMIRDNKIDELKAKQQEQSKITDDEAIKDLEKRRDELSDNLTELSIRLQKREQIERSGAEIAKLENQGRTIAQQIADVEKREYTAAQFSKKKIEDCEQRINGMFSMVRFQLFDYTQEGNEFEVCIPLIDGTPYTVANTAKQVNAGLDIINTLCRFNNISAPVFIDGAESINHYIDTLSQMIFLQVTADKELVIK